MPTIHDCNKSSSPDVFRFRQFEVCHRRSAMKVGTDGVLLGAWCMLNHGESAWDVGAGTGLIALMLAQRGAGHVDAVEIDAVAAEEAAGNIAGSPWPDRIAVCKGDISSVETALASPDLIVSNPPFFTETLHSPKTDRATARHEGSLTFGTLFDIAARRLRANGRLACIAPSQRCRELIFEAQLRRLHLARLTHIRTVATKEPKRVLMEFTPAPVSRCLKNDLIIKDNGAYTDDYRRLTSDFYLFQ